ncbi:beta-galactosidase-1-like protein 3, partial [Diadema antillarum]|uniref:beta-galactosidase-1-like protein 3 n=1 Tax=Diadema antillarum TaxID=105358 RepID=UPI003A8728E0
LAGLTKAILEKGASVNFYMYHGGTNFGFMNGGNYDGGYKPTITSYDYDAPLSEAGDTTEKFFKLKEIIQKYTGKGRVPSHLPDLPVAIGKVAYPEVKVQESLSFPSVLEIVGKPIYNDDVQAMEKLPINNGGGQGYGFLLYRTRVPSKPAKLKLTISPRDRAQVLWNGEEIGVLMRKTDTEDREVEFGEGKGSDNVLDILVENLGRINYDQTLQHERKGWLSVESLPHPMVSHVGPFLQAWDQFVSQGLAADEPLTEDQAFQILVALQWRDRLVRLCKQPIRESDRFSFGQLALHWDWFLKQTVRYVVSVLHKAESLPVDLETIMKRLHASLDEGGVSMGTFDLQLWERLIDRQGRPLPFQTAEQAQASQLVAICSAGEMSPIAA